MRRPLLLSVVFAVALPVVASAQSNSLFGTRGPNGQGTLGSTPTLGGPGSRQSGVSTQSGGSRSGMTGSTFAGSAFGGSTQGSGSFGESTLGSGSFGGGLTGGTATGSGQQNFQLGSVGQSIGTGAFVGRSDNAGRFVGDRMAGQQAAMGAIQALQGFQGFQRGGGFNQPNSQQDRERLPMRPTQRIAFDFTPATPAAAVERVTSRFDGIVSRRPELSGVTFATDDSGRVVLRGTVPSDDARQLAAALVRLEPGVREVVNELTVGGGATP